LLDTTSYFQAVRKSGAKNDLRDIGNRIRPTRGFLILVARLTTREHKRIFLLCHYFATMKQLWKNESSMWEETKWQD
jgi:hypothetical protein